MSQNKHPNQNSTKDKQHFCSHAIGTLSLYWVVLGNFSRLLTVEGTTLKKKQ